MIKIGKQRTISEWEDTYDVFIVGYQGFPDKTDKNTMLNRNEFLKGCLTSTLRMNESFAVSLRNYYINDKLSKAIREK